MIDMVEEVAKAMWDVRRANANNAGVELEFWGDGAVPKANGIMDEARAAIEAMREPTDRMICAVLDLHDSAPKTFRVSDDWHAMIDAALSQTSKER